MHPTPLTLYKTRTRFQGHKPQSRNQQASTSQSVASPQTEAPDRFQPSATKKAQSGAEKITPVAEAQAEVQTMETPAPSLADMPDEILRKIARSLQSNDTLIDYLNLSALKATGKNLNTLIKTNKQYEALSKSLKAQIEKEPEAFVKEALEKLPTLPLLQQRTLINNTIHATVGIKNVWAKLRATNALSEKLEVFTPAQHQQLIDAALSNKNEWEWVREKIIETLLKKLEVFSPAQHLQLFDAALCIKNESNRSKAIQTVAKKLEILSPAQRQQLIDATLGIEDHYALLTTLQAYDPKLEVLSPEQRQQLIKATLGIEDDISRSRRLQAFGPKLEVLSPEQRQQLIKAAWNIEDTRARTLALQALLFDPLRRQQLGKTNIID